MESGKALGNSNAIVETYRAKAETASSEFSEINNMLLRVSEPLRNVLYHTFREGYESSVGVPRVFNEVGDRVLGKDAAELAWFL